MKILTARQIREADQYTIKHEPIASEDLMERASQVFVKWFEKKFPERKSITFFCGIGNNGGDGLAVARLLAHKKYPVKVFIVRYSENSYKDFQINVERLKELKKIPVAEIHHGSKFPEISDHEIVVDALWGSGLNRPIEGFAAKLIQRINRSAATKVAIDIPSGLYADKPSDSVKIKADYTLTFESPKLSFFFAENYPYAGELEVKSIGLSREFLDQVSTDNYFITKNMVVPLLKKRKKFDHKGTYGHALLVSGSYGKIGATVLAAKGCLRAGVGLLSVHVPKCGYSILQTSLPEAMVMTDTENDFISNVSKLSGFDAVGIGPGIGQNPETAEAFLKVIKSYKKPLVIDADALNILGENKSWLKYLPAQSILTPHPKEFERVFGKTENDYQRHSLQRRASKKFNAFIILKGGHTAISCPDGSVYFNSTGNPGMATAGAGDVLTGILTGLLAQGYDSKSCCILGVYLHGLAGDIAARKKSQPAMIASDITDNLGNAFKKIFNLRK